MSHLALESVQNIADELLQTISSSMVSDGESHIDLYFEPQEKNNYLAALTIVKLKAKNKGWKVKTIKNTRNSIIDVSYHA